MPILPSLDQQLASARAETESGFICAYIDTCLSSFLHDHHHRDGELLLGAIVFGDTSIGEVRNELLSEFDSVGWYLANERAGYDHDKARQAILDAFSEVHPNDLDRKAFDPSLDLRDEDDDGYSDEYCQAWFLISWDVPEENEPSD